MRIRGYEVPDVLANVKEVGVFWRVMLDAVAQLRADFAEAERETHADTAASWGLDRWEKVFRLTTDESYTQDERQTRIRVWNREILLYGENDLKEWIYWLVENEIRAEDMSEDAVLSVEIQEDGTPLVTVRVPINSEKNVEDVKKRLEKIVPIGTELDVSPLFKTFLYYHAYTWAQLRNFTFNQAKRGVTPSLPPAAANTRNDLNGLRYRDFTGMSWKDVRTAN